MITSENIQETLLPEKKKEAITVQEEPTESLIIQMEALSLKDD